MYCLQGARAAGKAAPGIIIGRTLAFSGVDYSDVVLKSCQTLGCDVIRFHETRHDGKWVFVASINAVYCYGDASSAMGIAGHFGVEIDVEESNMEETGGKGIAVECISDRVMKERLALESKPNGVAFVISYTPTKMTAEGEQQTIVADQKRKK